ncbi:MAG TPA: hypothetical protein VFZ09_21845 [Archangium sp.]|uniref:hypothetical protein n=1 Tax=Archangium sp. TaxID=1872627 RepID=UPI002E32B7C2|nr:hypothetical protein [Archangium sp.]HEX5748898.1 hypothetical protein [Archangium sp.]
MTSQERILRRLDEKLDSILDNPEGWGGIDALEPLVLLLLLLRAELATPRVTHAEVLKQYRVFLATRLRPGVGDIRERLGDALSLENMVALLREHVSSVRTNQRPSTSTVGFPRYMAVESEARH